MKFFLFDYRFKNFEILKNDIKIIKDLDYSYVVVSLNNINNEIIERISKEFVKNDIQVFFSVLNKKSKKHITIFEPKSKDELSSFLKKYYIDVILNPSSFVNAKFIIHDSKSAINKSKLKNIKNKTLFFAISYSKIIDTDSHIFAWQYIQDLYVCYKSNVPTIISFSNDDIKTIRHPWLLIEFFHEASNENIPKFWIRDCLYNNPKKLIELKYEILPGVKEL